MGGGVNKGARESVDFAAEGLRIPGLRLLERALKESQGISERVPGGLGKLSRSIMEVLGSFSRSPRAVSGDGGTNSRD